MQRFPYILIEDRVNHIDEALRGIAQQQPKALSRLLVFLVCRPGSDATSAVLKWLVRFPSIHVAAVTPEAVAVCSALDGLWGLISRGDGSAKELETQDLLAPYGHLLRPHGVLAELRQVFESKTFRRLSGRLRLVEQRVATDLQMFRAFLSGNLQSGGFILTDIQLDPLVFSGVSIFDGLKTASDVCRGLGAQLYTMSNKPLFADQKEELALAGVEYRGHFLKRPSAEVAGYSVAENVVRRFPYILRTRPASGGGSVRYVGDPDEDNLKREFDVLIWPSGDGARRIGGRRVITPNHRPTATTQCEAWESLAESWIKGEDGVTFQDLNISEQAAATAMTRVRSHLLRDTMSLGTGRYHFRPDAIIAIVDHVPVQRERDFVDSSRA